MAAGADAKCESATTILSLCPHGQTSSHRTLHPCRWALSALSLLGKKANMCYLTIGITKYKLHSKWHAFWFASSTRDLTTLSLNMMPDLAQQLFCISHWSLGFLSMATQHGNPALIQLPPSACHLEKVSSTQIKGDWLNCWMQCELTLGTKSSTNTHLCVSLDSSALELLLLLLASDASLSIFLVQLVDNLWKRLVSLWTNWQWGFAQSWFMRTKQTEMKGNGWSIWSKMDCA